MQMDTLSATVERVDWASSSVELGNRGFVIHYQSSELTETMRTKCLACDQRRQELCHIDFYHPWCEGFHVGNPMLLNPRHLPK